MEDNCPQFDSPESKQPTWQLIIDDNSGGCNCGCVDIIIDKESGGIFAKNPYTSLILEKLNFNDSWWGNYQQEYQVGSNLRSFTDIYTNDDLDIYTEQVRRILQILIDKNYFKKIDVISERIDRTGIIRINAVTDKDQQIIYRHVASNGLQ